MKKSQGTKQVATSLATRAAPSMSLTVTPLEIDDYGMLQERKDSFVKFIAKTSLFLLPNTGYHNNKSWLQL
jgi:hypothetical protein